MLAGAIRDFGQFNTMVLSFLVAFIGQYLVYFNKMILPGVILFALAVVIFILSDIYGKKDINVEEQIAPAVEVALFLAIMAVAVFFRVWMLDQLPSGCYRDEGENGNEAINIMNGIELEGTATPVYIERLTQQAAMYNYFIAVIFKIFGIGVVQIRAASVVFGVLCVPAVYFLVRHLFGVRLAVIGAFLLAVTRWHINFSRIGFVGIVSVFFVAVCLYFAYRVYRKRGVIDFVMLGATTALSLYSYIAARFIPVGLFIFMAYVFVTERSFFKNYKKQMMAGIIAFLIVFAPLGLYVAQHPQNFMNRASKVSIFNKDTLKVIGGRYLAKDGQPKSWISLYAENTINTILMFNYRGDGNSRHNYQGKPMLDFVSGMLFVLGFGYVLYHFRKPRYFLLLVMFGSLVQPGLLTIESPQALRTVTLVPLIIIFIVIFLQKLYEAALAQYGKASLKVLTGVLAALMLFVAADNYTQYFEKYRDNPGSWADFSVEEYSMAKYIHDLGPDWTAIVQPDWIDSYTFHFGTYPYQNYERFELSEWVPIKSKIRKNFTYVIGSEYLPLVPLLRQIYPNGKYGEFRHKFNQQLLFYFTYEVPYDDIKKFQDGPGFKNGLNARYYYGTDWKGKLQLSRVDPLILFNWTRDPVASPFSVLWEGRIFIKTAGEYQFRTVSNDFSDVYIDGKKVVENPGFAKTQDKTDGDIKLSAGYHSIRVRYSESIQHSKMHFWWKPAGADDFEIVPSSVLFR